MWNLENKTNEHNRIETDSQRQRTKPWLPVGGGMGKGVKRYKLVGVE